MKFNKYLIAAMITVGVMRAASAQDNKINNSTQSQESYLKRGGPEPWVINSARQTQEMKQVLALNDNQLKEVRKINESHAKEIEVARKECGDDVSGLNSYIDRVSNARDRELKSVLTAEQFAYFTSKKNSKNWLGMEKFKNKSEDGELKVKNEKKELKIKGKNNSYVPEPADMSVSNKQKEDNSSDAFSNNNNIIIDSVSITEGVVMDTTANTGVPEIKTYPGSMDTSSDEASMNPPQRVRPEYDNMYMDSASASMKECEEVSKKSTKTGSTYKKKSTSSKSKVTSKSGTKTSKTKATAKSPSKSKTTTAAAKSKPKKSATAKSGVKKNKSTQSASSKKKMKVDTCENKASSKVPVMPDTTASSTVPFIPDTSAEIGIPMDTTARTDEFFMMPDTTATIMIIPDTSAAVMDTTSSASTKAPNHFIDKDSKAKFSKGESKIKSTNQNKEKETDSESKSKNGDDKAKDEKNESKVKKEDLKIKIDK
jgi:hypothetical protein